MQIKAWLFGAILIVLVAGSFAAGYYLRPMPSSARQVILRLGSVMKGTHVGSFVALDKGFFREAGLDVTLATGRGTEQNVIELGLGQVTFGTAEFTHLINARGMGYDEVMIGMMENDASFGFATLARDNITTPQGFIGKSIAIDTGSDVYLRRWFAANGVNMDTQINVVTMDSNAAVALLLQGGTNGVYAYYGSMYVVAWWTGKQQGTDVGFVRLSDFNWPVYGTGYLVTRDFLDKNREMCSSFMHAVWKGYDYYCKHPAEGMDIMLKYNPQLDRTRTSIQASQAIEMMYSVETAAHGYGYMDPAKVQTTLDLGSEPGIDKSKTFTNDFTFSDLVPPATPPPATGI